MKMKVKERMKKEEEEKKNQPTLLKYKCGALGFSRFYTYKWYRPKIIKKKIERMKENEVKSRTLKSVDGKFSFLLTLT